MGRNIDRWCHHTIYISSLKAVVHYNTLHHNDDVSEQLMQYINNDEHFVTHSSHLTSTNGWLPGRPLDVSINEYDVESVSSMSTTTLALTGVHMATEEEDSNSEFFDALDNSINVTSSSPVTMTIEKVEDKESLTTSSNSKVSSSNILLPSDKEEVIPLRDSSDQQQLNVSFPVSMTTLLHFMYIQNIWVATDNFLASCEPTIKCRRENISPKPNVRLNLWAFVKNSIGKDLSRIPLPVSM